MMSLFLLQMLFFFRCLSFCSLWTSFRFAIPGTDAHWRWASAQRQKEQKPERHTFHMQSKKNERRERKKEKYWISNFCRIPKPDEQNHKTIISQLKCNRWQTDGESQQLLVVKTYFLSPKKKTNYANNFLCVSVSLKNGFCNSITFQFIRGDVNSDEQIVQ